jgi:chromosome segregation protein
VRLTRLELHGFKSFADQSELVFEPGVTAIVGPNGCGKSNISDAVRWVLGEQRARALRGAKMEEVIFQGSSARRSVNIAEVSLHFDNDDGCLHSPYREVVITRRLSRSGESEYLLNRTPCRLRDIHDLVRGTGLGADSGVVIEARMIDALLSDRPDERRELFEEAAGVGLYRDRRRSTERRLEETGIDLARLDDLIAEVQSQVRSLARQRKKAERYTELTARRFTVEVTLAGREMAAWREELARLEARVAELRAQIPALEDQGRAAERVREEGHNRRTGAEAHRAELARLVGAQQQDAMRLESELRVAEERQRNATARRERAQEEHRAGEELGRRLEHDREQARSEREQHERELVAARDALAARVLAEDDARRNVADARAAHERAAEAAQSAVDEARRLEHERAAAERELSELAQRLEVLRQEREHHAGARELARAEWRHAALAVDEATHDVERAVAAFAASRAAAEAAREHESAARGELFRAEEHHTSLLGKVHALESLDRERVGLAPGAARLLRERDRFGEGAILGPLSDFLSAGAESALLIERFLGNTVHAVVVRDASVASAVRDWHAATRPGALLLLPLDAPVAHPDRDDSLVAGVDVAEPARNWARALLGQARAIADGSAFVDGRGAIWLPGSATGPGPLRRRAELFALRQESAAADAARGAASQGADAARSALDAAERAVALAADASASAQQGARAASEQRDELERRVERVERELSSLEQQEARIAGRRDELRDRLAALDRERESLVQTMASCESGRQRAQAVLGERELSLDTAREERTRWQVEQAQLQARLQMASDRERRLAGESTSAGARLEALLAELSDIERADSELAGRMAEWRLELEGRHGALHDGESRLADAEREVRDADAALEAAEHRLEELRRESVAASEESHHAELRLTELSGRRAAIRERLEAEWRRPLDDMLAAVPTMDLDDEALRSEVATLRGELEQIGPVNPLAVEEHDEELKRLDFLTTQRTDLAQARASLQQAIREIDVTARELFLTTFTQVRENFRQIFMTLFGGGECDLRLENPELPLDCDIEIHASPRGKRTQRIHLLSSGERALVALSLLFGIFLTKPSPFCLLDEVDAPLDDQNVARFVRMLNQFKMNTQFIVITHNPRTTTEAADAVYGVTMQEPGVSSFVSVRMRGAVMDDVSTVPRRTAESAPAAV